MPSVLVVHEHPRLWRIIANHRELEHFIPNIPMPLLEQVITNENKRAGLADPF